MLVSSTVERVCRMIGGFAALASCMLAFIPTVASAAQYSNATVTLIQSATPTADCTYFMLSGVTQADPSVPGNAWFAVPKTQNGYTNIVAMLISGKLAGAQVTVVTTGAVAGGGCGTFA